MKKWKAIFTTLYFIITLSVPVMAVDGDGVIVTESFGTYKMFKVGGIPVMFDLIHPEKLYKIGEKYVKYDIRDHICQIGDEKVETSHLSGKLLKVGDKSVIYSGNKISSIGNAEVTYFPVSETKYGTSSTQPWKVNSSNQANLYIDTVNVILKVLTNF